MFRENYKNRRLRILLVCPHIRLPGTGGAATHHTEFSKALSKLGIEVHVLADSPKDANIGNVYFHTSVGSPIQPKRFLGSVLSVKRAVDICKKYNIDVIHDRCDPGQLTGYLTSKICHIPRVSEINYNFLSYETKMSFFKDKVIYPFLYGIKLWWIKRIVGNSEAIICVSNSIKDSLVKHGLDKGKIIQVPNGADPNRFKPGRVSRKKYCLSKKDLVLALIGELGPRQNVLEIIKSIEITKEKIPQIKLLLVGGDERYKKYLDSIKNYVEDRNLLGVVCFIGKISNEKVPNLLRAVDIALAPYSDSWSKESFGFSPMKVFEYMASGKIVIASDAPWMREIIKNWENGVLLKSFGDLGEALIRLTSNAYIQRKLRENARRKIVDEFNWNRIAETYRRNYKKVL